MVPSKEAFLSGPNEWSRAWKIQYTNDLDNPDHLIAIYRNANRSKGARDPARWLPPNKGYHREYVRIWLEIKKEWGLLMDAAEAKAVVRIHRE